MVATFSDIQAAEDAVTAAQDAYLRRWGWDHTSNTPGAQWLWKRDFADEDARRRAWDVRNDAGLPGRPSLSHPYGVITTARESAIWMTVRCLDEQPELNDDPDQ